MRETKHKGFTDFNLVLKIWGLILISKAAYALDHCEDFKSKILGKKTKVCIYGYEEPLEKNRFRKVLYWLHGMNENYTDYTKKKFPQTLAKIEPNEHQRPVVITFSTQWDSFHSDWKDKPTGSHAYESFYISELIPTMENRYNLCRQLECRLIGGHSMGGLAALKNILKYPYLFARAGALSPALSGLDLYESYNHWWSYWARVGFFPPLGNYLIHKLRGILSSKQIFEENDPFYLIENYSPQDIPPMFIAMGGKDYLGFYEGFFRMKDKMDHQGQMLNYEFDQNRGHDVDEKSRRATLEFLLGKN